MTARQMRERIAATGTYVSMVSYVLFWAADLLRPGFVARYFSVHLFLLASLVFGAWYLVELNTYKDWALPQYLTALLLSVPLAFLVWNVGEGFGDAHMAVSLATLAIPVSFVSVLRSIRE